MFDEEDVDALEKMLEQSCRQVEEEIPMVMETLHSYLNNSSTEMILLRAVKV